jgi:hypothetical protein
LPHYSNAELAERDVFASDWLETLGTVKDARRERPALLLKG